MLTDAKVRAAKSRDKSYKLTDANRLYLLVTPSGGRLWRWNYDYDGKQKSMAFGAYSRRMIPAPVDAEFRFPARRRAA